MEWWTEQFYRASGIEQWEKKRAGTSYIERFNNTFRQRVSRLVRKTLNACELVGADFLRRSMEVNLNIT